MVAEIYQFMDASGRININAWRHDICARLLTDHAGPGNGISTRDFCMIYFGYVDLEKTWFVQEQMQAARHMLMDRQVPMILRSHHYQWYVVAADDTGGARGFIQERAKRFVRGHRRLQRYSEVGQKTYSLPPADPLLTAIEGSAPAVQQIDRALQLPSP